MDYVINEATSSYLMVMGYYNNQSSYNYIIDQSQESIHINTAAYAPGYYTISLICDGVIVDATILYKN